MTCLLRLFFLFSLFFHFSFSLDTNLLPRPLILDYSDDLVGEEESSSKLRCRSWRVAGEANNLSPWKSIPEECEDYVKEYMLGRGYAFDLQLLSEQAEEFAKTVQLNGDGKDAWIFDIDETLLSNIPYYADHRFGLELFDHEEFNKWVDKGIAPAIEPSLKLYENVLNLGFKVILLTGRSEWHRSVTVDNLISAGFQDWHQLILRASEDHGKLATVYKSEKRTEMEKDGYRILGNSGDQWSDLLGSSLSVRSFKLPNPMYYIP